jgi:hypothetical protein
MIFTKFDITMDETTGTIDGAGADRYGKFTWTGTVKDKSDGWGSDVTFESIKTYTGAHSVHYNGSMNKAKTLLKGSWGFDKHSILHNQTFEIR